MRVAVIGTGLIGGSIGLALAALGHEVVGFDRDRERLARARGAGRGRRRSPTISTARRAGADVAFVAVPVGAIADAVVQLLDAGVPLVTDVGSVKGPVVAEVGAPLPRRRGPVHRRSPDGRFGAGGRRRRATPTSSSARPGC